METSLVFDNNALMTELLGEDDEHISVIEQQCAVDVNSRGNALVIAGDQEVDVSAAREILQSLYTRIEKGQDIALPDVQAAIRLAGYMITSNASATENNEAHNHDACIQTPKKQVRPYSKGQAGYMQSLAHSEMVFAIGPAGTGKTYLAVARAVEAFTNKEVERIILSRPAVEAGEKLGFLPGDVKEKIDPYLRPLYDALYDMMPAEKVVKYFETGEIEIAPLAYMRGRTLSNACVILDESQNTTPTQMKMFLTRLGEGSRMIITGDLSQTDLPRDVKSGLRDAARKLENIDEIAIHRFNDADVVRHPLAARIVQAYDEWDKMKKEKQQ